MKFYKKITIITLLFLFICHFSILKGETYEELLEKGNNFYKDGKYYEAIDCYEKVLIINPKNLTACCNKANALYALDYYGEAIIYFEKVLKVDPDNYLALEYKKKAEDALLFQKEIFNTPEEVWKEYNRLLTAGQFDSSLDYVAKKNIEEYENMPAEEKEVLKEFFLEPVQTYDVYKRKEGLTEASLWFSGVIDNPFSKQPENCNGCIDFVKEEGHWKVNHISTSSKVEVDILESEE